MKKAALLISLFLFSVSMLPAEETNLLQSYVGKKAEVTYTFQAGESLNRDQITGVIKTVSSRFIVLERKEAGKKGETIKYDFIINIDYILTIDILD